MMFGDFNFVAGKVDRFDKMSGSFSGESNDREAILFNDILLRPHQLHEWAQPHHTCEMEACRSWIDRCYSNMAVAEQQDRQVECVALDWAMGLSTHRPIHFARIRPSRRQGKPPIADRILLHPSFPASVEAEFNELRGGRSLPRLAQLSLLKKSINEERCEEVAAARRRQTC